MNAYTELRKKIRDKKAVITVVGLGYVGLPMALEFSKKGFMVHGLDKSEKRVKKLKKGVSYIKDVSDEEILRVVGKGNFRVTTDDRVMSGSDVIMICVPTPLSEAKKPDVSFILAAGRTLRRRLRKGQLIVLESTTYPGTTREVMLPILEKTGLSPGKDFFLAFSPERIDPGNPKYTFTNIPKLVGGFTKRGTELARLLYSRVVGKVVGLSSPEAAEVAKLLENTFRIVNIGLINEFATLCNKLGIDVWEVIDAARTKPFGFMPFYPGPGVGGHCIPADPMYLSWKARKVGFETKMIDLAAKVNRNAPAHIVERIEALLRERNKKIKGARILIIGVAYKRDVNDLRESPALDILQLLKKKKVTWTYHDPYIPFLDTHGMKAKPSRLTRSFLKKQDMVIIITDHSCIDYRKIASNARLVFDTRNAMGTRGIKGDNIVKL
ncbi:MAG: nucleotide sugar dehydrogenase [Candidatus Omnitrophota bacterium]|nr:nucleotide sugar dehydrogenase [Candidatus Omnitrophota bacterium]